MKWVVNILGGAISKLLGSSRSESFLSATANIFVYQTEAPLVVRPFIGSIPRVSFSLLCAEAWRQWQDLYLLAMHQWGASEYLIAASFMAAPGGLLFAKIIIPETEKPIENLDELTDEATDDKPSNVIDAAATGAASGLKLALNVGAMLLAFVGLIAHSLMGSWRHRVLFGMPDLTLEMLLGYLFSPVAFLIGVPWRKPLMWAHSSVKSL